MCSDYFTCLNGVRQGENVSPMLFYLFLNDLESSLTSNGCAGITIANESFDNILDFATVILVLLYADDTVLLAQNVEDLQKALDNFSQYCDDWKLEVSE